MEPTVEELVSALLLDPTLACQVVRELCESCVAGPWELTEGSEQGYERTYVRRHISGISDVASVGRSAASAVWWPLDGDPDFAGSPLLARVAADAYLVENGWLLADRGVMLPWELRLSSVWVRRARNAGVVLARVRQQRGTWSYELEDFAMSAVARDVRRRGRGNTREEVQQLVDQILHSQGWGA